MAPTRQHNQPRPRVAVARTTVNRCAATLALAALLGACGPTGSPAAAAAQFKRAVAAGDVVAAELMVSPPDRAALASARKTGLSAEQFGVAEPAGDAGVVVDSTAVVRRSRDSAVVLVFGRRPNWDRLGGRFDYSSITRKDRAGDPATVASLPRVLWIDTVTLAAERQGIGRSAWKVVADLPFLLRTRPHWVLLWSRDSALDRRAAAASALLSAYRDGKRPLHRSVDSTARALLRGAAYADSVGVSARRVTHADNPYLSALVPREEIHGDVVNRSGAILKEVDVVVLLANGSRLSGFALNVPPHGRKDVLAIDSEVGDVAAVTVSNIELAAPPSSASAPAGRSR